MSTPNSKNSASTPNSKNTSYSSFSYSTPSPRRHTRSPKNRSSEPKGPVRKLYLIRHGESLGQRASRQARKKDPALTDCGLSRNGQAQAVLIPSLLEGTDVQLLVTSPLTRAIQTTLLAFPTSNNTENLPIMMAYDLREIGSPIPENQPRKLKDIWRDLRVDSTTLDRFDLESLKSPEDDQWPSHHETPPKVVRRDRVRKVFGWLASHLPPEIHTIAVVCHYHVIRNALTDPYDAGGECSHPYLHPINAQPVECKLLPDGRVQFVRVVGEEDDEAQGFEL
eukprot:CAMPEP_0172445454 /NCGR_PEP_ID=MMETSP1065-20121228/5285_1 /TAXON_ID=265537 /ORGANISM="Amphiprora paludosa, Strain CCMP125" /LENGTH=279 /DNA_ID=CAMNT_0013196311 /DNA_START=77 /DNA_END=916 /DNA_ORIENTATION=-